MNSSTRLAPSPADPVSRPRVSLLRNVGHGANDVYWFILPPILPLILQEFGLRYTAAGGIVAAFLCVTAVGSMVMGRLSDRVSPITIIIGGFIVASVCLWAAALMPTLGLVIALVLVAGIGVSTYHPAAYASINHAAADSGRTYGIFESSACIAIMVMLVIQGLIVSQVGWRGMIAVGAIPGAIMGVLFLVLPGASIGETGRPASTPARSDATTKDARALALPVIFVLGIMLRVLGVNAVTNFAPTYLVHEAGMAPGLASVSVGFIFLGGMIGGTSFGFLADRRGPFIAFAVASGLLIPVLPLFGTRLPIAVYLALLAVIGFCTSACLPPQNMILTRLTAGRAKGQVFGLLLGTTTLMSSASPLLFGVIADSTGLPVAIRVSLIPVVLGWLLTLVVWRRCARGAAAA